MNIIKSIFVSIYMMAAMVIIVVASRSLWQSGDLVFALLFRRSRDPRFDMYP